MLTKGEAMRKILVSTLIIFNTVLIAQTKVFGAVMSAKEKVRGMRIFLLLSVGVILVAGLSAQSLGIGGTADGSAGLHKNGIVYTWGKNTFGSLGFSYSVSHIPLEALKGEYSGTTYLGDNSNNKITAVAIGPWHSIALASDGTVYTMGYNFYGQLGMGAKLQTSISTPVKVLKGAYSGTTYLGDDSNNKITAVAVAEYHSIALASDGTVYTWGYAGIGSLGNNSTMDTSIPVKVLKGGVFWHHLSGK